MPVEVRRIPLSELSVRPPRQEEVSSVEASLRLDAIASAGGWRTLGNDVGASGIHVHPRAPWPAQVGDGCLGGVVLTAAEWRRHTVQARGSSRTFVQ